MNDEMNRHVTSYGHFAGRGSQPIAEAAAMLNGVGD